MSNKKQPEFTLEQRTIIADFVHAKQTDTLIVPEAAKLIEVLAEHKLIEDKEGWMKKVQEKAPTLIDDLEMILHINLTQEQGQAIMDEYYGKAPSVAKSETKDEVVQVEFEQHYNWGPGKEAKTAKPFSTVKIGKSEFELIHGEFPHSRQDNTTYARSKDNPERIYGFSGHRLPFKIEIEESNYLKSSHHSGDEIRKSCTGKLSLNGITIFEGGGRTYERAFLNVQRFIESMEEKWDWYPSKVKEKIGKIIKYEGQLFKIESFIVEQGAMILVTPDGKPRLPFPYEQEDVENNDFDGTDTVKVGVNSERIWWYPTKKEIAKFINVETK